MFRFIYQLRMMLLSDLRVLLQLIQCCKRAGTVLLRLHVMYGVYNFVESVENYLKYINNNNQLLGKLIQDKPLTKTFFLHSLNKNYKVFLFLLLLRLIVVFRH